MCQLVEIWLAAEYPDRDAVPEPFKTRPHGEDAPVCCRGTENMVSNICSPSLYIRSNTPPTNAGVLGAYSGSRRIHEGLWLGLTLVLIELVEPRTV